jgi:hypothetical protein
MTDLTIETQLNNIFNSNQDCTYVYISIGSKFNEHHVLFNDNTILSTNIYYQQIPGFIRNKDTQTRILSIMIDTFNTDFEFAHNIVDNIIKPNSNIKHYIINKYCTTDIIQKIISTVLCKLNDLQIIPENFIICNFIKFRSNPNKQELLSETTISYEIQNTLNDTQYIYGLYEWFGYNISMYNFIYNYKKSRMIHMFNKYIIQLQPIFEVYQNNDYNNLPQVNVRPIILHKLLSCVYNITSPSYNNKLVNSVFDEIKYNKTISV